MVLHYHSSMFVILWFIGLINIACDPSSSFVSRLGGERSSANIAASVSGHVHFWSFELNASCSGVSTHLDTPRHMEPANSEHPPTPEEGQLTATSACSKWPTIASRWRGNGEV